MIYGILGENNKFILVDEDREKLRATALMLAKEVEIYKVVDEESGELSTEPEKRYEPMFDDETVDEFIKEYEDEDIVVAYNGEKYSKGKEPLPTNEYQKRQREKAYENETDGIVCHINRLQCKEQTEEVIAKIAELKKELKEKTEAIKERYPFYENN